MKARVLTRVIRISKDQTGAISIKETIKFIVLGIIVLSLLPLILKLITKSGKESYKIVANSVEDAVDGRYVERRNEAANSAILPSDRARMMAQMRAKGEETSSTEVLVEYKPYMYENAKKAVENLKRRGAAIYVDSGLLAQLKEVVGNLAKLSSVSSEGKDWAAPWQKLYDEALHYQKNRSLVAPSSVIWPAFPSQGEVDWVFEK